MIKLHAKKRNERNYILTYLPVPSERIVYIHTFIHFKPRWFYDTIVVQEIVTQKRRFTTTTPLWCATLYDPTPLPQVVAAQRPDSH